MGKVTVLMMDAATESSGHQCVPNAVSVCITPAAPSPLPIPYPVIGSIGEGITDPPMRTKFGGVPLATTGSVLKACHGNEAGTLKEVVSLNTGGPIFIIMGAPTVLCELGMVGMTGSMCISNKAVTVGAGANASDASGASAAGSGSGASGSGDGKDKKADQPKGGGGSASSDKSSGASASSKSTAYPPPSDDDLKKAAEHGDTPEHRAARKKVAEHFYDQNCKNKDGSDLTAAQIDSHVRCIDHSKPVKIVKIPPDGDGPNGDQLHQHTFPGRTGQYFTKDTTTTADQVGANPRVLMPAEGSSPPRVVPRKQQSYTCSSDKPAVGIQSTAAPANDTWSHPGEPRDCSGGGTQVMVPFKNQGGVKQN
jgi:hypothetical protein